MSRLAGLVAVCTALTPLPLLRTTPGFASRPLEWAALLALALLAALAIAAVAALCRPRARRRAASLALSGWALLLLGAAALGGASPGRQPAHPLVLIGIDGAGWPQVDRLRAAGQLPTFDALLARGARAELATLEPVLSPPIWTSIASGVSPERHGVFDFWSSADAVRAKRIWDVADERGLSSGVFGWLVTWPPRKRGGFLVPSLLAADSRTVPPGLSFVKELESRRAGRPRGGAWAAARHYAAALGHGATLGSLHALVMEGFEDAAGDERRLGILALRTDVFCHLLRRQAPDLAVFYQNHVDAVSHLFYRYFEPDAFDAVSPDEIRRYGDRIPRIYRATDASIARILACAPRGANLVLVSDHGQRAAARAGRPLWVLRSRRLLEGLGLGDELRATHVGDAVLVRAADPGTDMARVAARLRSVVTEPGAEPLLRIVQPGPTRLRLQARRPPRSDERVRLGDRVVPIGELVRAAGRSSGEHTERAILLLAGPDVEPGARIEGASVLDVAPTLLALLRLPVARDLEGRVLGEALRPGLPVSRVDSYGAPELPGDAAGELDPAARQRLEALGYLE